MDELQTDATERNSSDSSATPDVSSEPAAADARYFEDPELEDTTPFEGDVAEPRTGGPSYSTRVGDGDAETYFAATTPDEAEAALDAIAAFCQNCPIHHQCAGDECAVHRAEAAAERLIEDDVPDEGRTAVGGVVLPARYAE